MSQPSSAMLSQKDFLHILEIALSLLVAMGMLAYGIGKGMQFSGAAMFDDRSIGELSGMELMWAFYGYSKSLPLIIGGLQILGGIMILFQPTRLIACLLLTTILTNIILQDVIYDVNLGALKTALVYQGSILIIFWINRRKLKEVVLIFLQSKLHSNEKRWIKIALAIGLFVVLRVGEYYISH